MKLKPYYPYNPIASIEALAATLGVHEKILLELANKVEDSYTHFDIQNKNSKGEVKDRTVCEPKFWLKKLQKRINSRIFEKVEFPDYLQGGIKDVTNPRDYVANAQIHSHANQIICIDIKKFYPNIKAKYVKKVFQHFFKFPENVSEILTKLVTYNDVVPQGGCCSSYIANLIFFENEYRLVSFFQSQNIKYSRLLDDITISSDMIFSNEKSLLYIKKISGLFNKYELKIHNGKTKIEHRSNPNVDFEVTGLWIGQKQPKARKEERRFIRQLVYMCEQEYKENKFSEKYHTRWNEASGKVAKLQRLGHKQAKKFRQRLSLILPLYDDAMEMKLVHETKKLINIPSAQIKRPINVNRVNVLLNKLGILSRSNKALAKSLRIQINDKYVGLPSKSEIWEY